MRAANRHENRVRATGERYGGIRGSRLYRRSGSGIDIDGRTGTIHHGLRHVPACGSREDDAACPGRHDVLNLRECRRGPLRGDPLLKAAADVLS